MKISGNKGEWSELYVLIKLLAEGKIYSAKENLQRNENSWLPILKIFREENGLKNIVYKRSEQDFIEVYLNDIFINKIKTSELEIAAKNIFSEINKGTGSFSIDCAENIMKNLQCEKIKADSREKKDITIEIKDPFTNFKRICGFSIKSKFKNSPTLFNASGATNFIFEVENINDEEILKINSIQTKSKVKDRINRIEKLKFISLASEIFENNLFFVDMRMSEILAEVIEIYYRENISDCTEIIDKVEEKNPLNFKIKNLYRHKFKKFLCAVALGLQPTKIWNGLDEANGGYIIVKDDGEILAYHLYDRNSFENYLLQNTKLETASTGRHKFGKIYKENEKIFIKLNLQIRFK